MQSLPRNTSSEKKSSEPNLDIHTLLSIPEEILDPLSSRPLLLRPGGLVRLMVVGVQVRIGNHMV